LQHRKQDSDSTIEARMEQYNEQIAHREDFDHVITNDDLDEALMELTRVVDQPVSATR
jgi:guanylate kinase